MVEQLRFMFTTLHSGAVNLTLHIVSIPIIIAGGLKPENVQQALAILEPWGVDATSGLESIPGQKDVRKVQAFCTAVKNFRPAEAAQLAKEKI